MISRWACSANTTSLFVGSSTASRAFEFISHDHASGKISQHGLNIVAERNGVLVAVLVNVVGQFGKLSLPNTRRSSRRSTKAAMSFRI